MKRIAIFCDGTWNSADAAFKTNVFKLYTHVPDRGADGVAQKAFYIEGVGTGRGPNWLARKLDKFLGGALGSGLLRNIEEAYRYLATCYESGDEIYIFGFSRGAFTARSLAGLMRASSIPTKADPVAIYQAIDRYKSAKKSTKPRTDESRYFRYAINPGLVTDSEENAWRRARGLSEGVPLTTTYLGIWDTVGALGIPNVFGPLSYVANRKHRFHDTALSSSVQAARHGVAIDERRFTFKPTLWGNLDDLNGRNGHKSGDDHPYCEKWFPGDHGSVGGGGDITGLSDAALVWIAEGATDLSLDPTFLADHRACSDFLAPLVNQSKPRKGLGRIVTRLIKKHRKGPNLIGDVSKPAKSRWGKARPPYRPKTLSKVAGKMP